MLLDRNDFNKFYNTEITLDSESILYTKYLQNTHELPILNITYI